MKSTMSALRRAAPVFLLLAAVAVPLRGEIIEQVLVKVNGDILTKTELEQRQIAALRQRMNQDVDPAAFKNDEQLKKMLAEVTPRLLVEAVDEMLLMQLGKERGYRLSDQQFKEWLSALRKEQNLEDDQKFAAALKQEGMSIDELRKNVERQMLIQRVQQDEVGSKLSITEEEARQYYLTHQQEFSEPASVTLREILIEVPTTTEKGQTGVNVAKDDEAARQAAAVRARVTAGEDFAKLAGEVSAAPSKANGGLIGPIAVSEISESLQKLLQTMKPGDVTQPIRSARGYQILKLETLKPASVQAFDSVRDLVAERVHTDRQRQEIRRFLTRLRSQAIIEWKNAELQKAYEQQVAQALPTAG
ncbi:MAG TPA: peptidylprolyl isomerase [Vicinamibacterales bacterium]|jgi:peptidyl-prolyl cis-trans isomerase SurA|nr:peptidylprolyl isomerase [Vicinamibacterales bacterium]